MVFLVLFFLFYSYCLFYFDHWMRNKAHLIIMYILVSTFMIVKLFCIFRNFVCIFRNLVGVDMCMLVPNSMTVLNISYFDTYFTCSYKEIGTALVLTPPELDDIRENHQGITGVFQLWYETKRRP